MSIRLEDIAPDLQEMAKMIGMDNFIKVCKFYGGKSLYIPLYKNLVLADRNRKIMEEYNGKNLDELRQKYSISNTQLKRVLRGK